MRPLFFSIHILLCMSLASEARMFSFDDLDKGSNKSVEITDTLPLEISEKASKRHSRKFAAEEEEKRRASEEAAAKSRMERSLGNGNRYYDCEFACRTSGLLYDGTDKFHQRVKADESWEAERIAKEHADKMCRQFKGREGMLGAETMWETGLRCNETH